MNKIFTQLSGFFQTTARRRTSASRKLRASLFAVLSLLLISAALRADSKAATIPVCPSAAFTSIQAAVNAASPGDTIQVCAGTFDEDVSVGTANLIIEGAGSSATSVRGPIGGGGSTFAISASNVEIRNFTITRLGNNTTDWNNPGLNTAGISIAGAVTGISIHDNVITGNRTGIDINNSSGHTVRNNVIDFNRTGLIFRNQTDNLTVVENFITNNWTAGIVFLDASGGTNSPVQRALNSRFRNNSISANWYAQIVDRQNGGSLPAPGTNPKDFRGNWFGTTSPVVTTANSAEPGYAAQIPVAYGGTATPPGGQPDVAGPASANFRITPILQSGTDTDVQTTPGRGTFGFQGNFAPLLNVTPATSPTATDNDYTRINDAVQLAGNGNTITLNGTFNWAETNAAASWALGNDGAAGTADDYHILVPANLNGVTFTAPNLGAATIQGPGDLQNVAFEGVLYFNSATVNGSGVNQGWTISNVRFLDFDWTIYMDFNAGGSSSAYNNTQIVNNYIRMPQDLAVATNQDEADFQNVGIHFSFGTNQTISGNTIDLPGNSVSSATSYAANIGMQSNTSGGAIYNGLQITNNTFNVLNAQNNANPELVQAIWENCHAHLSNINVSGNQFLNLAAGNNPATNFQFAITVTSHSSATTTVTYANNRVVGARVGFEWLDPFFGADFSANQPVKLIGNVILNNRTGVLVQSKGVADLSFNRIVGNTVAGVNNVDGSAKAENNWWGCNYGPGATGAGCAVATNGVTGTVDANPWLTLSLTASPDVLMPGGTSTLTASTRTNSDNSLQSAGTPNGTAVTFGATGGTVSPTSGTTTSGDAVSTFTAGASYGAASGSATIDGQTASDGISIVQNNIAISPAGGAATATDNDYTRINNAVQGIANGGTITLNGTFNWTEPNAAASWALGSNGTAGGGDDYSILVPSNRNGVTFTASSLGAATIQGPGDLAGVNLEGVFYFNGGDNQNWTISNIRFLDFDLTIGMFNGAGGSDAFNGTVIQNNYIRIPNDLNATAAPADVNQNIGIHFSFGTNQTISGNTIETPGDGVSSGTNFSSIVGMQSNTSGGAVYNNLQITNNTLNVLNAQNNANPQTFLGIWENSHGHTSNITVSGNQVLSVAAGNNPAVNLVRGFRVTSHSSATTTVTYSNNRVEGANVGFQWLAAQNFAGNQPVRVTSNVIRNNATGVLVQSQGSATLSFNRIVGNSVAGVNNVDGLANAENNWWGCNFGPGAGGAGCAGTANGVLGTVDANPWLVLRTTATPNTVNTGGTSNVQSNLNFNSDNANISALGTVPNGTPATFTATLGTVSPTSSTTTAGAVSTTFTAGAAAGTGGVQTTIDGQTVNAPITVNFTCNNVSISTNTTVASNAQFLIPINVDDTTGRNILSYDFTLTYDASVVTFVSAETAGTLSSGWTITPTNSTGTLNISGFNTSPLTGSGVLLNLRFIANGGIGATGNLNFSAFRFNEGVPCVNTSGGNVTVISGTISGTVTYVNAAGPPAGPPLPVRVPNVTINAAGSTPLTTTTNSSGFYSLSGFGAGPYTVTPSKTGQVNGISNADATRIAQHVVGFAALNSTQLIAADVSGNGTITSLDAAYVAQYIALIANPSSTGTWRFTPASRSYPSVPANDTDEDYGAILMGEVTGNWNPAMARGDGANSSAQTETQPDQPNQPEQTVTVTAEPKNTSQNANFTVDLTASNTSGEGILGYEFDLTYNPNVIMPQGGNPCTNTGTLSSGLAVVCNPFTGTPGLMKVVLYGTAPLNSAGTLLKLNFTAVGNPGQSSPLTFQNFMFNEGNPADVTVNGQVNILAPTAAAVSFEGQLLTAAGRGVANARVSLTDATGASRTVISNAAGFYRFESVDAGQTYIVSVESKRYKFRPQPVSVLENVTAFNLIAEP